MSTPLHETLWQQNADLAGACLAHPFVRGIGDGTLGEAAFKRYIAQDAYFLRAFARGYALCAAQCEEVEDFRIFYELQGGVLEELRTHGAFAVKLDIDLAQVQPFVETTDYTDFLLATAKTRPLGEIIAAMTPCMRLYAYLGQALAAAGTTAHAYREWIEAYSSAQFEALAASLEACLDRFVSDQERAGAAYRRAMECELAFFSAPLRGDA